MYKFLIGPALMAAGYGAGSYYGSDAEQLVHKSPSATYAGFEQALGNVRSSGMTSFEGGSPVPYEIRVDRTADQRLAIDIYFSGQKGAEADLNFTPSDNGKDTMIVANVHGEHAVLRSALAGTSREKLAFAPDWMLNIAMHSVLKQLASHIEQGDDVTFEGMTQADAEAQWESNLSADERQQVSSWRQSQATQPAVDPGGNAAEPAGGQ